MNFGLGTNTKAELVALWGLASLASTFGIEIVKIYWDSMVIVKWVNQHCNIPINALQLWCRRTSLMLSSYSDISIEHVFHALNVEVDSLSKEALDGDEDVLFWEEFVEKYLEQSGFVSYIAW